MATPYNQETDEDEWLAQQAAQAEVAQPQTAAEANPWSKAQAIMQKQAGMQYQAPERYSKPVTAEKAPARNDWGMIAAMAMSLLGNKGKDLGGIVMQGVQNRNQQLRDWREENSPAALQKREMMQAQLRNADRQGFEAERAALGAQASQEMQLANAQVGEERAQANAITHAAEHQDQVAYQDKSLAQSAADSAARLAQSGQFHQDSLAEQRAARAQSAGQFGTQMAFNRDRLAQDAEHDRLVLAGQQQAAAAAAAEKQRAAGQSFGEQTEDLRRMIPGLNAMTNIVKNPKYKNDLPGVGALDQEGDPSSGIWGKALNKASEFNKSPEWKKDNATMRQARKDILEFDLRKLTGAGAPEAEKAQEMLRQGGTDEATVRHAIGTFNNALKLEFQSRAGNGNRDIVAAALQPYGWDWESPVVPEGSNMAPMNALQGTQPSAADPLQVDLTGISGLKKRGR